MPLTVAASRQSAANSKRLNRAVFCRKPLRRFYAAAWLGAALSLLAGATSLLPQPTTTRPARPTPPARDPNTPGYVAAKELPDGAVPPVDADGNFILGPT